VEQKTDKSPGMLYLVATPIGNKEDITLRALRILREVDLVVCEELREGHRLLRQYGIEKPLLDLNEHNEAERVPEVLARLREGQSVALISDAGMPVVQDPGEQLVRAVIAEGIRITCAPGPSSITTALALSGLPIARFRYVGYVPAKKPLRRRALAALRNDPDTIVLAEAPYRLTSLLKDIVAVIGAERRIAVTCDLTMPQETIYRGTAGELLAHFLAHPFKGEFIIVIEGAREHLPREERHRSPRRKR